MRKIFAAAAIMAAVIHAAPAIAAPFDWTGFYIGVSEGAALGKSRNSDPFIDPVDGATPIFGDRVRSPGSFTGGQFGFNYQVNSTVFGIEADLNWADLSGTFTCLAPGAHFSSANCQVHPNWFGALTGRVGWAVGPSGRALVYGKGGLAWTHNEVDITLNQPFFLNAVSNYSQTGWTAGAGIEYALTGNWSAKFEYDYLSFGSHDVATPRAFAGMFAPNGMNVGLSQDIHTIRLGLNYRPGRQAALGSVFDMPRILISNYEIEAGARYVYGWGRFQKNFGLNTGFGSPPNTLVSRLTYDGMKTNGGELFARVDTPNNFMLKGFVGLGSGKNGFINDEDWDLGGALFRYSNTLTEPVRDRIKYATIDAGYDWMVGQNYKVASFIGYNRYKNDMYGFGCAPIVAGNCLPVVPNTGNPIINELDSWGAMRVGTAGEVMLLPQLKLSADLAYLPYVSFKGVDHHFFGNSGVLFETFPASGHGRGVQLESILAYEVTKEFSLGIGGRYWSMWTTKGTWDCTFTSSPGSCGPPPPTPLAHYKAAVEQAAVFVQASYRFR